MNGPAFATYVRNVLIPEIAPGTVVILDNLSTHKNAEAARAFCVNVEAFCDPNAFANANAALGRKTPRDST